MDNLNFYVDKFKKFVDKVVDKVIHTCEYCVKKITYKKIFRHDMTHIDYSQNDKTFKFQRSYPLTMLLNY